MKHKTLGVIILIDVVCLLAWLGGMILMINAYGEIKSFDQALAFATERHPFYYTFTYANAVLFSLLNSMVFAGLYGLVKDRYPLWSAIGFVFIPVYSILAIISYLSQLVIIPPLIELLAEPRYQAVVEVLLRNLIQNWSGSTLGYFDQFSYFILGIPSLIFGLALLPFGKLMKAAGLMLALSGASCLLIGPGVIFDIPALISAPSMLGGVLSITAFIPLSIALLRGVPDGAAFQTSSKFSSR